MSVVLFIAKEKNEDFYIGTPKRSVLNILGVVLYIPAKKY